MLLQLKVTLLAILLATAVAAEKLEIDLERLRILAGQGFADAQYVLGEHHYRSNILGRAPFKEDFTKALEWFRKAAEQGHAGAQWKLGQLYYDDSYGIPENRVQAYLWHTLALPFCSSDNPKSFLRFFECLMPRSELPIRQLRDGLVKRMTPAEIEEAKRLTEAWAAGLSGESDVYHRRTR